MGSKPIMSVSLTLLGSGSAGHPSAYLGEFGVVGQSPAPGQRRKRSQVTTPSQGVRPLLNLPDTKSAQYLRVWYQHLTSNGLTPCSASDDHGYRKIITTSSRLELVYDTQVEWVC